MQTTITSQPKDVVYTHTHTHTQHNHIHRHGAEVARGAHNSEDTRSKRVAGIIQFVCFREVHSQF